ncbi:SDR family oxidoreductase [Vandammella animalimorsus]|uniref:SDR family oxidoreductase n=1 Tax=Vandammella animalimorsus TaxID=2029117 RepID=A0A3M6RTV0_9BURK|nr:SDR family NAD(P)-dependent oxidoreductase [Vandammella animalimorsus]RMX18632.1 SDR family oxidoreductase [Vandammella animalimorsus]
MFKNKAVIVTGAAQGIGLAVARRFAQEGANLALLDVDAARLRAACASLRQQGARVHAYEADVCNAQALQGIASQAEQALGPCDVLVSNAGVLLRGPLDGPDALTQWRRTLAVNLDGCFYAAHAWAPQLRRTQGCIVNMASIHAFVAVRNSVAYTASKGGLKQLTQALALELGPSKVRVNAVAPGLTATDMTQGTRQAPTALATYLSRVPLGCAIPPEAIAHAVRFLASPEAACITGVTLPVDGGYCAT